MGRRISKGFRMLRLFRIGIILLVALPSVALASHGGMNHRPGDQPDCHYEKAVALARSQGGPIPPKPRAFGPRVQIFLNRLSNACYGVVPTRQPPSG